jgi:hypothetical protein
MAANGVQVTGLATNIRVRKDVEYFKERMRLDRRRRTLIEGPPTARREAEEGSRALSLIAEALFSSGQGLHPDAGGDTRR